MKYSRFLFILIFMGLFTITKAQVEYTTGVFNTPEENTYYHHFTRDFSGGAAVYINQISTGPILRLSSGTFTPNANVKFSFENNGRFGIGTVSPSAGLHVVDNRAIIAEGSDAYIYLSSTSAASGYRNWYMYASQTGNFGFSTANDNYTWKKTVFTADRDGNIGIGVSVPEAKLHIVQSSENFSSGFKIVGNSSPISGRIWMGAEKLHIDNATAGTGTGFTLSKDGNIGINTSSPQNALDVNGTIRSKEVKVEASPWPDYVFTDDYDLPGLQEIDTYIRQHGHLPEIPTSKEVGKNGISLGEMNARLLEKIEQLMIYTIEQEKRIKELEEQNKRIDKLESILNNYQINIK